MDTGDFRGAVRLACSEDSIAEENDETILALQSKHPVAYLDSAMPSSPSVGDVEASLSVSVDAITKAISSFPRGSAGGPAGGPDGLLPQHLHDLTHWSAGAGGSSLLHALVAFSNLVLSGDTLATMCPLFFGATLLPLQERWGHSSYRHWMHPTPLGRQGSRRYCYETPGSPPCSAPIGVRDSSWS